jgi:ribosomal protein S18 acetylase RimI-like enzyme
MRERPKCRKSLAISDGKKLWAAYQSSSQNRGPFRILCISNSQCNENNEAASTSCPNIYPVHVITVRPSSLKDADAVWKILEPTIRAGETYALPRDFTREQTLEYWYAPHHETFVAEENSEVLGAYYLRPNQQGGGSHVANCGYMTAPWAAGRGIASAMCAHSLDRARELGFRAMQFNIVISTNEVAVRLWQKFGFEIAGRLAQAFHHPKQGYVDAYVMYRQL